MPESNLVFIHIHKNAGRSFKLALKFAYNTRYSPEPKLRERSVGGTTDISNHSPAYKLYESFKLALKFAFNARYSPEPKQRERSVGDIADIPNHVPVCQLYELAPQLRGVPLLSVKRNPWDRLHSAYCWWSSKEVGSGGVDRSYVDVFEDFEDFVFQLYQSYKEEFSCEENPFYSHPQLNVNRDKVTYPDQLSYFRLDGEVLPCRFLSFENLNDELGDLLVELFGEGVESRIERIGKSGKKDYRPAYTAYTAYTAEMREMVAEIYAEDAERLGYSFDG